MTRAVYTYFGDTTNMIEDQVRDLLERGAVVVSLAIGYGPPPARVAGRSYAPEMSWHGMVVVEWPDGVPE